jgi:hypothetical protein
MRRPLLIKILASLVGLLILTAVVLYYGTKQHFAALPNELQHISGPVVVPFEWAPHKAGELTLPHAAMIVPVTIGGCKRFRMQFDLGATSSVLYRSKMDNLAERCAAPPMIDRDGERYALNMDIGIGDAIIYAPEIKQRRTNGKPIDWANPDKPELIGTLGSDLIDGKFVVIDYPAKKIIIGDKLPSEYCLSSASGGSQIPSEPPSASRDSSQDCRGAQPMTWGTFTFEDRRILMAAKIDGRDTRLYFDTGSSAFELLTNESIWSALATPGAKSDVITMNSWGRPLTLHRTKSDKEIEVAGVKLPLGHVTRVEGASLAQNILGRVINMGGMTGNALFVERVLVLDVKQGRVGVAQKK